LKVCNIYAKYAAVDDHGNNSLPFSFRAVNARGSQSEQESGGFYTSQFWIDDPNVSKSSTITNTNTGSHTTVSATSLATTHTHASKTSAAASTSSSKNSSDSNDVAVGAGVGVGVGAALLIGGAFAGWMIYRRKKRRDQQNSTSGPYQGIAGNSGPPSQYHDGASAYSGYNAQPWPTPMEMNQMPAAYAHYGSPPTNRSPQPSELGHNQQYFEAPGPEPGELPTSQK
jgi:hypothetical protein